jgi:hypothetical protein
MSSGQVFSNVRSIGSEATAALLTMDSRSRRDAVALACTHNEEHRGTNQERR